MSRHVEIHCDMGGQPGHLNPERGPDRLTSSAPRVNLRRSSDVPGDVDTAHMTRLGLVASGTFFFGYLAIQLVVPARAWFDPDATRLTWRMYSGRSEHPRFAVVFADGTTRELGLLMRRSSSIRVLGPSVDQARFAPPFLCQRWPGVRIVLLRYSAPVREEIVPCPAAAR